MTRSNQSHVSALLGLFAGALALLAAMGSGGAAPPAPAAPVADATGPLDDPAFVGRVHQCVDKASDFLLHTFMPNPDKTKDHFFGKRDKITMSLFVWALDEAGVQYAKEPALQRGYAWLISQPQEVPRLDDHAAVISNSLRVLAICAVKDRPPELQKCLEQDLHWLLETALRPEGYPYEVALKEPRQRNAIECSYWAIRALDAASKQGVAVPANFWPKLLQITWDNRAPTGGWQPYRGDGKLHRYDDLQTTEAREQITPGNPHYDVTFITTVAGICSMEMCLAHLSPAALASPNGRAMSQGLQEQIHWLDSRTQLPTDRVQSCAYFGWSAPESDSIYATGTCGLEVERGSFMNCPAITWLAIVGQLRQITGQKSWGKVDPYRLVAEFALGWQGRDGGFSVPYPDESIAASIILFLTSEPAVYPPPVAATQAARPGAPLAAAHPAMEH